MSAAAFRLTVLGCSGTYAQPGGACSGYLLRSEGATVWLDAGPGTLANLQRHVPLTGVDAVVLSHQHPDHWLELPVFRNALKYVMGVTGVPVYSTAGTLAAARAVIGGDLAPTLAWHTITDGDEVVIGDQTLRFARTDHPVETLACRVTNSGRSLLYSSDTGPGFDPRALVPDGQRVDLALIEATALSDVHLSGAQAGKVASTAGAGRIVVTHLLPGCDAGVRCAEVASTYDGPIDVAAAHATYII